MSDSGTSDIETLEIKQRNLSRNSNGHNFSHGGPIQAYHIWRRLKLNQRRSREIQGSPFSSLVWATPQVSKTLGWLITHKSRYPLVNSMWSQWNKVRDTIFGRLSFKLELLFIQYATNTDDYQLKSQLRTLSEAVDA